MGGKLVVDTQQLSTLGTQLGNVRDKLAATRAELDAHAGSIGSPTVLDAFRGFEDHWTRGRRELTDSADALAQMLTDSANSYLDVDGQLESGLTTQTVAPGPVGSNGRAAV